MLSKELELYPLANYSLKEIYSNLIPNTVNKLNSNNYFEKLFENTTIDWSKIYLSPCLATIDTTFFKFFFP